MSAPNVFLRRHAIEDGRSDEGRSKPKIMRFQVGEIVLHPLSFVTLHELYHLVIDLQQPQPRRYLVRTDDEQIDSADLGSRLGLLEAVVDIPLIQPQ